MHIKKNQTLSSRHRQRLIGSPKVWRGKTAEDSEHSVQAPDLVFFTDSLTQQAVDGGIEEGSGQFAEVGLEQGREAVDV